MRKEVVKYYSYKSSNNANINDVYDDFYVSGNAFFSNVPPINLENVSSISIYCYLAMQSAISNLQFAADVGNNRIVHAPVEVLYKAYPVRFTVSGGTLPAPLATGTTYWINCIDVSASEIYSSKSGAIYSDQDDRIILTDTGSGTQRMSLYPNSSNTYLNIYKSNDAVNWTRAFHAGFGPTPYWIEINNPSYAYLKAEIEIGDGYQYAPVAWNVCYEVIKT